MAKKAKNKKEELKDQLYKLIDSIEDEHILQLLKDDVVPYVIEGKEELTEEQERELDEAIKEADAGNIISYEEFRQNMDEWVTKFKSTGGSK
jgi:predicted transcriptional regulator